MIIRRATADDLDALARLGRALMRTHCNFDQRRYLPADDAGEAAYRAFLEPHVSAETSLILVAEEEGGSGEVVGYVLAADEPPEFKELRDRAGFVHDILVADRARGSNVGTRLLETALAWLDERGVPRVILWCAEQNAGGQRLFERHGFRRTMIEMTRERP